MDNFFVIFSMIFFGCYFVYISYWRSKSFGEEEQENEDKASEYFLKSYDYIGTLLLGLAIVCLILSYVLE